MQAKRKKTSAIQPMIMAAMSCLVAGTVGAADMTAGYTIGAGSQLLVGNGGSGTNLFVDYAAAGGTTDLSDLDGTNVAYTVLIDGAGQWSAGDTVEITGFALQVQGAYTAAGTMTFDIRQGSGGSGDSGAGGLASLGTATASYVDTDVNATMYVNFDTPVSFVVDANSLKIGINIANSAALRIKAQSGFPVARYNYTSGALQTTGMRVSVAGNVIDGSGGENLPPEFSSDPFTNTVAYAGVAYNQNVAGFVSDPDNDLVNLSILSGPAWLGLDGTSVTGTPQEVDIGLNNWLMEATDGNGGTTTATMVIDVKDTVGVMVPNYVVGSGLLAPNGETLFVDTAALGGNDLEAATGTNAAFTVLIDGAGFWQEGDAVKITGVALPIHAVTASGTMSFEVLQGVGGIGSTGAGGLATLGTATAPYVNNGSTSTMYVNFENPVQFIVDANSTKIGIHFSNTGFLRTKGNNTFPVPRYNRTNGDAPAINSNMYFSVSGTVVTGKSKFDFWTESYGITNSPSVDSDSDGLSNIKEYGLGGNPTNGFIDALLPAFGPGTGGMLYVHAQRSDDSSLVYSLSLTPNLVYPSWTNQGYAVVGTNVTGGTFNYVTNLIGTTDSAKFIQLEIEQFQ